MIYDDIVNEHARAEAADALLTRIIDGLDQSYDLIYIDRGDRLSDDQAALIVAGDMEKVWESFEHWESDARWEGVRYELDQIKHRLQPEDQELFEDIEDEVRYAIQDRETGTWFEDLVGATPDPILRVVAVSEDEASDVQRDDPAGLLRILGVPDGPANLAAAESLLANTPSEVFMGYWLFSADLLQISRLDEDAQIVVVNPYLVMGNPFTGAYSTIERIEGVALVPRGELRTDRGAFGYSVDECYGGLGGSFDCEIRVLGEEG